MSTIRVRKCGHCRQVGHDRRRCISLAYSNLPCLLGDGIDNPDLHVKLSCKCGNCVHFREYNIPTPEFAMINIELSKWPQIKIINNTRSTMYLYRNTLLMSFTEYIDPNKSHTIKYKECFHKDEIDNYIITDNDYSASCKLSDINPIHIRKLLSIEYGTYQEFTFTDKNTHLLDQWKEAALKSHYLLNQLERLGVSKNENYEAIMDMVQDINFPKYDEQDKERSGISSQFTNVTQITGINE